MAKKKKGTTKRRIGKAGSSKGSGLQLAGTAMAGGAGLAFLDSKLLSKVSNTAKGAGEAVLGLAMAWKGKSPVMKGLGIGFAVWGTVRLIQGLSGTTLTGLGRAGFPTPPAVGAGGNRTAMNRFATPPAIGQATHMRTREQQMAAMYAGAGM